MVDPVDGIVRFNGVGEWPIRKEWRSLCDDCEDATTESLGHETFYIERDDFRWGFCKTARKPYDLAVCACLICLQYWFPELVEVDSDGDIEDWLPAQEFVQKLFGVAVLPPSLESGEERRKRGVQVLPLPRNTALLVMRGDFLSEMPQPGDPVEVYTDQNVWYGGLVALSYVTQGKTGGPYEGQLMI